jgi:hypothetical protein
VLEDPLVGHDIRLELMLEVPHVVGQQRLVLHSAALVGISEGATEVRTRDNIDGATTTKSCR